MLSRYFSCMTMWLQVCDCVLTAILLFRNKLDHVTGVDKPHQLETKTKEKRQKTEEHYSFVQHREKAENMWGWTNSWNRQRKQVLVEVERNSTVVFCSKIERCVCVCKNIFSMTTTRLSQIFMVLELHRHCFNAQFVNRKHQCVTTVALQCHAVGKHVPSIASVTSNN